MAGRLRRAAPGDRVARAAVLIRRGVTVAFAVSGVVHLARPEVFTPIVPERLPAPRRLVHLSGVAELVCAGGLLAGAAWAGPAGAGLLLAIWPANVSMARQAGSGRHPGPMDSRLVTWVRVPLQLPMVWALLAVPPVHRRRTRSRARTLQRLRGRRIDRTSPP